MILALIVVGLGAVYILGAYGGVSLSEMYNRVDSDQQARLVAEAFGAELDGQARHWRRAR